MEISITITEKDIQTMLNDHIAESIKKSIDANRGKLDNSVSKYFEKGIFETRVSTFEKSLDWAVEQAFREGISKAMKEANFKDVIAAKAAEILVNNDFVQSLAIQKVRASLGLNDDSTT